MKVQHRMVNPRNTDSHRVLSAWFTGLVIALLPGLALASDYNASARDTVIRHSLPPHVLTVADNSKKDEESTATGDQYDPAVKYEGIYKSVQLYRRNPDSGGWLGSAHPSHLKQVGCSEAKNSLNEKGSWKGQINKDGSCGTPAEPADWALGNLLNYEDGLNAALELETQ